MCTAITYKTKDFYFGRTLDLEYNYKESITVTPRGFYFPFGASRYAIIGIATVEKNYPLYYDAVNEKGLCAAGLAFWYSAEYNKPCADKCNVPSFELIPYVLSKCSSVCDARELIENINITNEAFSDKLPPSPLHWMIADREESIVVESTARGIDVYDNPVGVLTNEPSFEYHLTNLNNYINITASEPTSRFAENTGLSAYSRGMGAIGLPGDNSSVSRFVRAAFTKLNSVSGESEKESVNQFFHILGAVNQVRGTVKVGEGLERTVYTSCCNADKGIYYYTTYENSKIVGIDMHREDLDGKNLVSYPLLYESELFIQNKKDR